MQVQRNSCHWSLILVTIKSLWFPTEKGFPSIFAKKKDGIGAENFWHSFTHFWWQSNHIDFRPKKVSLQFSPKYRDVLCAANLCYSFTYFGDSAITLIFAKGWGSLAFSKMMVKKVAKIGWKMNSVSYLVARADMLQVSSRIWEPPFFQPKKCLLVLTLRILIVMRLKEVHNLLWE